jgi:glycosyltransferase involved in cell wall biosynthesis
MTKTAFQVWKAARRTRADVYHLHDPELLPFGLLSHLLGTGVIYDVHEDYRTSQDWLPCSIQPTVGWLLRRFEQFCARRFDAVVFAGNDIARGLDGSDRRKFVVRNYPSRFEFECEPSFHSDRFGSGLVVAFGGLTPLRCASEIVRALALLPKDLPVKLVMGGDVESESYVRELEANPGWTRVDYHGRVAKPELLGFLRQAAVSLVLYSRHPNHYAVRSNRFFESLAAGVPVIASRFGEWEQAVEGAGCGLVVDPERPEAIAEALAFLLRNPQQAAKMGHRGRELFLQQLNWESEKDTLLAAYDSVLRRRNTSVGAAAR